MVLRQLGMTVGSLPDDVLLEIFYAYKELGDLYHDPWHECWPRLVHVCRRWRLIIFASPHRLDLRLLCTPTRPVRRMLDIWPAFPLLVYFYGYAETLSEDHFDNFFAALERRDRVHEISVSNLPGFLWERITTVVQEPFPALTALDLKQFDVLAAGDIFLTGSAPNLQHLTLRGNSIPRRLRSATHLRSLRLHDIPNSGYIPPETMAATLSALPQLKSLTLDFESPTPQPKRRNRPVPPLTRFVLPALTWLRFQGVSEYLEVLTARIDAPLLEHFEVTFFHQLVFDIPQIIRFFGHHDLFTGRPSCLTLRFHLALGAYIVFSDPMRNPARFRMWYIRCKRFDWQVFSVAQICSQIPSFRSSVESLNIICTLHSNSSPEDEIDTTLWLQLFHSFTSVRSLEISEPLIAAALQPLTEQPTADVLPSLRSLSVLGDMSDETTQQNVQLFVGARQHSGCPVTVSRREST
jgi:F-box-like